MLTLLTCLIASLLTAFQPVTSDDPTQPILEQLDAVGRDMNSLEAAVRKTDYDNITGQEVIRRGRLYLRRDAEGKDVRFRVTFNGEERESGGLIPRKKEYTLVGDKLIERDWPTKTQITRVLTPEQANRDLLKLGEGPFPLPIGQSPADVRKQFAVTVVDPTDEEQNLYDVPPIEGATRIRLTPLPGTAFDGEYEWIELDVDGEGFPRQVTTLQGPNLVISELRDPELNKPMPDETFELPPIDPAGWNIVVEEMAD